MDENPQPQPHSVQQDQPAESHAETREETIARVVDETEAVGAERGGSADPSSRRGLNRTLAGALLVFGVAGAVVGGVLGLVLSLLPGPFETSSVGGALGYIAALAVAGALIAAVIGTLLTLAREDGRVEREVEEDTGRGPEGVGAPSAPEHDLTER
jgi:Flp pilus assembly protein TadB